MVPKNNSIRHQTWVESTCGDSVRLARTSNIKRVCLSICVLIFSCISMVIPMFMLTFDIYVHTYMFARVRTCFHIYIYIQYNHEYIPEVYICASIRLLISKHSRFLPSWPSMMTWTLGEGNPAYSMQAMNLKQFLTSYIHSMLDNQLVPSCLMDSGNHVPWILVGFCPRFWWDSVKHYQLLHHSPWITIVYFHDW